MVSLKQDPDHLHYRVTWPKALEAPLTPPSSARPTVSPEGPQPTDDTEALLKNYLNLHHDLTHLYTQWATADPNFRKRAPNFTGVRILNQDAWETLVGFICSSNNNIARISQMVHKLCLHYGPHIATIDDEPFHDFPPPAALAGAGVESHLRELGFGYRAKYIAQTAMHISQEREEGWLDGLRNPDSPSWPLATITSKTDFEPPTYKTTHEKLLTLTGVGPKVADCVCLMGLGWGEAVPVDTHVWQIAMRDYKFGRSGNKTLTKAMYDAVGDHFRGLWGTQAGWAHSVLFTADLRAFSDRVVVKKVEEKAVKVEEGEEPSLITPVGTPLGTPAKRKRATVVKVKVEEETDSSTATSTRSSKRRRTRM